MQRKDRGLELAAGGSKLWRQICLGSSFVLFGLLTLSVGFVVAPAVRLRARSSEEAEILVQRAIQLGYLLTFAYMRLVGVLRIDAEGLDDLAATGPCIIVANHPTLVDAGILGSYFRQLDCIVNAGWTAKNPFLASAIKGAGYIRNDGGAAAVQDCASRLQRGRKLLVFPEGTRSPLGSLGRFQRGTAHISLASGAPVVALTIRCRPRFLSGHRKWHELPSQRPTYEIRVAGRLHPEKYKAAGVSAPIAARRMTEDLLGIFLQEPNLADA